jgi:hypothetical protein
MRCGGPLHPGPLALLVPVFVVHVVGELFRLAAALTLALAGGTVRGSDQPMVDAISH